MSRRASAFVAALAAAGAPACDVPSGTDDARVARAPSAIQGGTADGGSRYAFAVAVQDEARRRLCSGVLLAPNLVLTARHCVSLTSGGGRDCASISFQSTLDAGYLSVTDDETLSAGSRWVRARAVRVPSGASLCGNDVALIVLDGSLGAGVVATPLLAAPDAGLLAVAPQLTAIGYGVDDPTSGAGVGVRRVLRDVPLMCDGAGGCGDASDAVAGTEIVAEGGGCDGDSGSGAFEQGAVDTGAPVVFGVLSRGPVENGHCVRDVYTRTDAFAALIMAAAREAALVGGYAVPAWAGAWPRENVLDAGPDGGGDGGGDGGVNRGDAPADAGGVEVDAGAAPDAAAPAPRFDVGGCAISASARGGTARSWGPWGLALLAALAGYRRRLRML